MNPADNNRTPIATFAKKELLIIFRYILPLLCIFLLFSILFEPSISQPLYHNYHRTFHFVEISAFQ